VIQGRRRESPALALGLALAAATTGGAWAQADGGARISESVLSPKTLYMLKCSGCHRSNGGGAASAGIPPFPGFIGPMARDEMGRTYITQVPGISASGLSDVQIAEVLNYVLDAWAPEEAAQAVRFTGEEVARRRTPRLTDVVAYRRLMVARLTRKGIAVGAYPWP
jgi:mono/diheme cytochrome c family protein